MSHLAELQEGRQLGKDCSVGFFVVNYVGVPNRWRLQSGLQTVTRLTIKLWLAVCIGHNVFLRIRQSFCLLDSISCILYLLPKFTVCWCFFLFSSSASKCRVACKRSIKVTLLMAPLPSPPFCYPILKFDHLLHSCWIWRVYLALLMEEFNCTTFPW